MTDLTDTLVVYLGERTLKGGKLGNALIPLDLLTKLSANEIPYKSGLFETTKSNFGVVGGIYLVKATCDDTGQLDRCSKTGTYQRMVNHDQVPVWVADSRATQMRRNAEREHVKAAKNTPLDRLLNDLERTYQRVAPNNRAAFKLMVLNRLEGKK